MILTVLISLSWTIQSLSGTLILCFKKKEHFVLAINEVFCYNLLLTGLSKVTHYAKFHAIYSLSQKGTYFQKNIFTFGKTHSVPMYYKSFKISWHQHVCTSIARVQYLHFTLFLWNEIYISYSDGYPIVSQRLDSYILGEATKTHEKSPQYPSDQEKFS